MIIDVTARRTGRKRPGIRIHRPRVPAETTTRDRTAVTTPARTILDLAAALSPGHRGATKLRRTIGTHYAGEDLSRSELEILFQELCRHDGLPQPRVSQPVAGKIVDFLFAEQRLIVETDSWRYHKTRRAFEDDRARDVLTTAAGYRTLRFTDRQLTRQPEQVAQAIAAVLDSARPLSAGRSQDSSR